MSNTTQAETPLKMMARVKGEGQPVVLVPGGLTGWMSWEPHYEKLSNSRKVILVQPVSVEFGLQNRPLPQGYSLRVESCALEATLTGLGFLSPIDLVAWSFGGAVALDLALDHPHRIRTLTLIEPPAVWVIRENPSIGFGYESLRALGEILRGGVSEAQLREFVCIVGLCPSDRPPEELPQWPEWVRHRQSLLNTSAVFRHHDDVARLKKFDRPVLLVKGTGSAKFLHQIVDVLALEFPHAQVIELPGGHAPHIVSIDRFLQELAAFQGA